MNLKPTGTLVLTRREVAALLTIDECTSAVERAFRLYGEGKTQPPGVLGVHAKDGGFHIKAGTLNLDRPYFAAKVNANFPQNSVRFALPLIQGVVVLCDAENGYPLAVMDSIEITIQRTGAATAVAARYLARPESQMLTICGCGNQGRVSFRALHNLFPFKEVFAFDLDYSQAEKFARDLSGETTARVIPTSELEQAVRKSDVIVTCTPAKQFFLKDAWVRAGTFIAAVGADSEDKQELEPALLTRANLVVDILEQAASIGELHHAIDLGLMTNDDADGELGEIVARRKPGRSSPDEIIIFDSTGMALQDVIVAAAVYEKAVSNGLGQLIDFGGANVRVDEMSAA
jgi:ornithine cyclodeaminase/alanine dehydrogenase